MFLTQNETSVSALFRYGACLPGGAVVYSDRLESVVKAVATGSLDERIVIP